MGLFESFVFVNYILFFLCNITSYGIYIDCDNEKKFYVIDVYLFVACVGQQKEKTKWRSRC